MLAVKLSDHPNGTTNDGEFWVYKLYKFKQNMSADSDNVIVKEEFEMKKTDDETEDGTVDSDSEEGPAPNSLEVEKELLKIVNKLRAQVGKYTFSDINLPDCQAQQTERSNLKPTKKG